MQELISGWAKLVASSQLPDALDSGEEAVVHLLGDTLDSWLQTTLPPYATAVQICATMSASGIADCDAERIKVRDSLLMELLEVTGTIELIRAALKAWRAIPSELRDVARAALQAASTLGDLYNDPSIGNFYRQLGETIDYTQLNYRTMYSAFLNDPSLGKISAWVARFTSIDIGPIKDFLYAFDFATDHIDQAARTVVSYLGGSAAAEVYDAATDPVGTVTRAVTDPVGTTGNALETAGDLVSDPVGTITGWW